MKQYLFILIAFLAAGLIACKHEIPEPPVIEDPIDPVVNDGPFDPPPTPDNCDSTVIYFEQDILPFFTARCGFNGCHDAATDEDGVTLDNYNSIVEDLDILDDSWEDTELYEVIIENDPQMPPDPYPSLTEDQINMLFDWIEQGAPNNSCEGCVTENITYDNTIGLLIQNRCQGCHNGSHAETNLFLMNYSQIQAQALNGPLLDAVQHNGNATPMPYNSAQLPQCEIDQITAWIDAGAPEN